nr:immunoglobulin heavy chain junction region [Macaca mulatta]MOX59413.1 immunoglobulin heavy chain junction region [Macaca mulatta]MOX61931.1 immunoglobulin heavy chain junction region [Macaca mulatta]MOX63482.1 immunoglobulin heavy chain junction region [Macaca mulatta]MOX66789.1 immunoglobulin heavy chain junction region [Macaca mulatta]
CARDVYGCGLDYW